MAVAGWGGLVAGRLVAVGGMAVGGTAVGGMISVIAGTGVFSNGTTATPLQAERVSVRNRESAKSF